MVRTSDASPLIDLSGVQTYDRRGHNIVYLRKSPGSRPIHIKGWGVEKCNHCGQNLQESFHYCSIGCKVSATGKEKKDGERATPSGGGGAGGAGPEGEGREGPVPSDGRLACACCPQAPAEAEVEAATSEAAEAGQEAQQQQEAAKRRANPIDYVALNEQLFGTAEAYEGEADDDDYVVAETRAEGGEAAGDSPMVDAAAYGSECIGRKVAVFWDLDRAWHNGCIIGFDPATRKHAIRYEPTPRQRLRGEDGDTEEVELALEEIVFEETEARAPLDVTKSAAVSEIRAGGGEEAGGAWSPAAAGEDGPALLGIVLLDTPEADRTSPSAAEQPPLELVLESLPAEDEITVRPVQPAPDRALVDHPVAREAFISEAEDTPTGNAGAPKTAVKRLLDTVPLALASGASPLMRLGEWGYAKLTGAGGLQ